MSVKVRLNVNVCLAHKINDCTLRVFSRTLPMCNLLTSRFVYLHPRSASSSSEEETTKKKKKKGSRSHSSSEEDKQRKKKKMKSLKKKTKKNKKEQGKHHKKKQKRKHESSSSSSTSNESSDSNWNDALLYNLYLLFWRQIKHPERQVHPLKCSAALETVGHGGDELYLEMGKMCSSEKVQSQKWVSFLPDELSFHPQHFELTMNPMIFQCFAMDLYIRIF